MALIEIVKNDGDPRLLAWRYPCRELGTWTQLLVGDGEEAVLITKGRAADRFPAGRYTLETANLPLLGRLVQLPFGGKSPFPAEIWFVNTRAVLDIKWGTDSPIHLIDGDYGILLSLRGFGQFGVRIADAGLFLSTLCGTGDRFDTRALLTCFRGLLMSVVKDSVAHSFCQSGGGLANVSGSLQAIATHVRQTLAPELAAYGICLLTFYISDISPAVGDSGVEQLRQALADRAVAEITTGKERVLSAGSCICCGEPLTSQMLYCPSCGKIIPARCICCGGQLPYNARYCPYCGGRVAGRGGGAPDEK